MHAIGWRVLLLGRRSESPREWCSYRATAYMSLWPVASAVLSVHVSRWLARLILGSSLWPVASAVL